MNSARAKPEIRKAFTADTPNDARRAATAWLGDFSAHGPLDLRSIRVTEVGDMFAATVVYCDMDVEQTPRHFENEIPLLKSA